MNCKICGKVFKTKSNYAHHIKKCNEQENKEILKLYYENLLGAGKIIKMGYNKSTVEYLIKNNKRSLSQQMEIFYRKNSRKVSEQTKQRIRDGRKKYMSMQRTNEWRRDKQTYIEKIFSDIIERNNLSEKFDIIREYSVFPYYLDFAFLNIRLDVEIDGSQHIFYERQKKIDTQRNEKLISLGWKVFRIPGFKLKNEFEQIEKQFLEYLDSFDSQPKLYNFSESVIEYYKFKKIKEKQDQERKLKEKQIKNAEIKKLKEETIKKKLQMILENSDITKRGWITGLSKKFKVSHTYIRRFLRLNFPEIDKQTYFKPRTSVKKYQNCDWKIYYSKQLLVSPHSDTV